MQLSLTDLEIISYALYQAYSSFRVPKEHRKENYDDIQNELQRRINTEITLRKNKE